MKAKSFYKNNKHNNMNPKEKENNQEEELKTQATPNECDEETVGQETSQENEAPLTEEEKLAQELEKANEQIEEQKDKYLRLSAEFDNYRKRTMIFFPSTKNAYIESVEEYGEVLETVVIEDIFMPELLTLLAKNEDAELLSNIFNYFEEIIKKNDSHLINIFSVTVLEILGNDKAVLKVAKQYMGEKTTLLQMKADKELGRL